ncbi:MAG: M20/M25/M40 family metallo-hydrolase [Deltaproteobacteria bacterium]|nr:M20/M25/M40 family metallo-hydrolase [Deltaproteobacteria bacterium]
MDDMLKNMTASLQNQEEAMRDALKRLVLIQSGTYNKAGVDRVCRVVCELLEPLPLEKRILPQKQYGDMLMVSTDADGAGRRILLAGHMDTIFPADSPFNGWREDGRFFYGPGVIDMKGGLVVGIFALKALAALGLLRELPVTWIFNSEEEIGSPASRPLFRAEAGRAAMAFVLECGGMEGEVATGRKGRLVLRLSARGRAGHAATVVEGKKSAILDMARVIVGLEEMNGRFPGISVNVGRMAGGAVPNSVPEEAWAAIDVRFPSIEGLAFFQSRIDALMKRFRAAGMDLSVEVLSETPVMEATAKNKALFAVVAGEARRLEIPIAEHFRAGASDANTIAEAGTPVIDGLGPIGEHDHSDREYAVRKSLRQRSTLLALSLIAAWRRYQAGTLFPNGQGGSVS